MRPTRDDLREEETPGILAAEALERAAPQMRDALQFVRDWLNGEPTPKGRICGGGCGEVREAVERALQAAEVKR